MFFEIYTSFEDFNIVRTELETRNIEIESAQLTRIPSNTIEIKGKDAEQMMKLMEMLDDHDDVQNVYANFDIEEAEMDKILSSS